MDANIPKKQQVKRLSINTFKAFGEKIVQFGILELSLKGIRIAFSRSTVWYCKGELSEKFEWSQKKFHVDHEKRGIACFYF